MFLHTSSKAYLQPVIITTAFAQFCFWNQQKPQIHREENYLEFYSHCLPLKHHFPQPLNLLAIICSCTANFESNSPKLHVQSQIPGARISTRGMINFRVPSAIAGWSLCEICRNEAEQTTVFNWTHKVNIRMPTVRVGCNFPGDIWVDIKSESSPDSKAGGNYFVAQWSKNSASEGRSGITDCNSFWMKGYKWRKDLRRTF